MRCPKCGAPSSVTETRVVGGNNRRRRHCDNPACFHRFTTLEMIVQSYTKHRDVVTMTIPKSEARELRAALALLDRGLAGELSQNLRSDAGNSEAENTESAKGDPLAVVPPPRAEDA